MGLFSAFLVEEPSPSLLALAPVAVSAQGDPVEHVIVAASDMWDAVVKLQVHGSERFGVAVGIGALASLSGP